MWPHISSASGHISECLLLFWLNTWCCWYIWTWFSRLEAECREKQANQLKDLPFYYTVFRWHKTSWMRSYFIYHTKHTVFCNFSVSQNWHIKRHKFYCATNTLRRPKFSKTQGTVDLPLDLVWSSIFVRVGGRVAFKCTFTFHEKRFGKVPQREQEKRF